MRRIVHHGRLTVIALLAIILATQSVACAGSDEGKGLYAQKCASCHSIGGEGGKMANLGGKLDGVGAKRDAAWLKAYIADPKSKMPEGKMPKLKLSDQEIDDLVAYLSTLK
jgi:mono/diheme cytochrome c family protein